MLTVLLLGTPAIAAQTAPAVPESRKAVALLDFSHSSKDVGAQVNDAIAALPTLPSTARDSPLHCGVVQLPAGIYDFSTTIMQPDCVTIEGNGAELRYTGTGIALIEGSVLRDVSAGVAGGVNNLWLQGPGDHAGRNLRGTGLLVGGDPSGSTPEGFAAYAQNQWNLHVEGFETNVMLGSYSSLDNFYGGYIGWGYQGIWAPGNTVGAGEDVSFYGTVINNNFHQGILNDACYEIKMHGGSIDYTGGVPGQAFYSGHRYAVTGSCVTLEAHGVHFEQDAGPIIREASAKPPNAPGTNAVALYGGELYASGATGTPDRVFVEVAGTDNALTLDGVRIFSRHAMAALVQWDDTGKAGALFIYGVSGPNYFPVRGNIPGIANWHVYLGNRLWGQATFTTDGTHIANAFQLGSGATWTSGSKAPSGNCINGSLYSNTAGGRGSTLYVCVAGAWVDEK